MTALIILVFLSLAGIGVSFWLLKSEQESEGVSSIMNKAEPLSMAESLSSPPEPEVRAPKAPAAKSLDIKSNLLGRLSGLKGLKNKFAKPKDASSQTSGPSGLLNKLLSKLKLGRKSNQSDDVAEVSHLPSFGDLPEEKTKETPLKESPIGTASITTSPVEKTTAENPLSEEEEKSIENEINLSAQLDHLKEKYLKLDALFTEKSSNFEEMKQSLDNELKNRKEFNKVKDLLEKEIKESKNKARDIQVERDNAKTEGENNKKRVAQLEEKVTQLQKDLLEKEDKINELVKRLQTFASPSTASTPPTKEEPAKEKAADPSPVKEPQENKVLDQTQAPVQKPSETAAAETPKSPEEPAEEPRKTKEENRGEASSAPYPEESTQVNGQEETVDQVEESENQPQEEEFLKLRPDIFSTDPKKESPIAAESGQSTEPIKEPETSSTDEEPRQQDQVNENNSKKE